MKTAFITGTSQRLGLFLCEQLLLKNWKVVAVTRSESEGLNELRCPELSVHNIQNYNTSTVDKLIHEAQAELDSLDLLVNNASIFKTDSHIEKDALISYQDLTFIHMHMPFLLMSAFQPLLSKAQGNIISITDIYSDNPNPEYGLYCSTKAGLKNLTLSAAKKWAPGIRANCIQPGPLKFLPIHSQADRDKVMKETLLPFEGGFDPIFKTIEFIVDNNYITGQCLNIDGGRSLMRG